MISIDFLLAIFIVALLFSACGQGGGSGFLAVMSLFSVDPSLMKASALLLNIFVTLISFYHYFKSGQFNLKLFMPLIVLSVPMAFIGASINTNVTLYNLVLGICLLITALSFLLKFNKQSDAHINQMPLWAGILTGGCIGFLSGLVGIGGGILLMPVMLLFNWASFKTVSAITSLFILVNSVSGISGVLYSGAHLPAHIFIWIIVAVIAAVIGSYWGSRKASISALKKMLSGILVIAAMKLLFLSKA